MGPDLTNCPLGLLLLRPVTDEGDPFPRREKRTLTLAFFKSLPIGVTLQPDSVIKHRRSFEHCSERGEVHRHKNEKANKAQIRVATKIRTSFQTERREKTADGARPSDFSTVRLFNAFIQSDLQLIRLRGRYASGGSRLAVGWLQDAQPPIAPDELVGALHGSQSPLACECVCVNG